MFNLGIDIGGTAIKYGVVAPDHTIIEKGKIVTRKEDGEGAILSDIASLCRNRAALNQAGNLQIFIQSHRSKPKEVQKCFSSEARLLCDRLLERLAGLEDGDTGSRDQDLLAGLGVAADMCLSGLNVKNTEADQLDLFTGLKRGGDGLENGVDRLLTVLAGQLCFFGNGCNEFCFVHG